MNINHHILSIQMAFSVRTNNRFFEYVWNFIKDPRKKYWLCALVREWVCVCGKKRDRFVTLRQHVSKECVLEQNNSIKFVFFVFDAHTLYVYMAGWLCASQSIDDIPMISVGYSSQHLCSCVCVCMCVYMGMCIVSNEMLHKVMKQIWILPTWINASLTVFEGFRRLRAFVGVVVLFSFFSHRANWKAF